MDKPRNVWDGGTIPPASRVDARGFVHPQTRAEARDRWFALAEAMGTDPAELRRRRLQRLVERMVARISRHALRDRHDDRRRLAWRDRLGRLVDAHRKASRAAGEAEARRRPGLGVDGG